MTVQKVWSTSAWTNVLGSCNHMFTGMLGETEVEWDGGSGRRRRQGRPIRHLKSMARAWVGLWR